jgi:hypothetical protein
MVTKISENASILDIIRSFINGSTTLFYALAAFSVRYPIHRQ